jgi:hypothetical protein
MKRIPTVVFVLLAAVVFCGPSDCGAETFEQGHQRLYATGEILKVGDLVNLGSVGEGSVTSVSFKYNMVRSALEVEWLYNGEVIGHTALPQGQRQIVSFDYGKRLPASIEVRFAGPAGHVQVLAVEVVAQPAQKLAAGSGIATFAGDDVVLAGEGVSQAVTPTPVQLDFIEPTQMLPTDPTAEGFDDSKCKRLICTLPPERLWIGDTGQDYVSSFYMLMQHAAKAAREEMPPAGHCAWWDSPMADDEPRQILAASYNARIDIEITWGPEIAYSFRPQRANINKDPEEPARFVRLWDSVMAGGYLDLCVEPRKVYSVTYLAVRGQY